MIPYTIGAGGAEGHRGSSLRQMIAAEGVDIAIGPRLGIVSYLVLYFSDLVIGQRSWALYSLQIPLRLSRRVGS